METAGWIALSVAVLMSLFLAVFLPLMVSGRRWKEAEEKARTRRLAEAKMNARLLRMNL